MTVYDPHQAMTAIRREFGEHGGVCPSISRSSTFTVMEAGIMPEIFAGLRGPDKGGCFLYSRHFNPTVDILARYMAALEATEYAVCTASGMAAISCTLLQLCRAGDHIVSSHTIYGGSWALLHDLLPTMGITTTFVNPADPDAFAAAIKPETKVVYVESLANPSLKVADIPTLARIAHEHDAWLVVDNTFTPMIFTPALHGADVTVHSLTKFINGASDLIGGVICAENTFIYRLMDLHRGRVMLLGPTMDPRVAFDVIQRLPHLGLRIKEHGARAMAAAVRAKDLGAKVVYPGLPEHPQHELMTRLMNPDYGFGGILTIDCGTAEKAEHFLNIMQNEVHFGLMAVSLGYYDTLISCSGSSTSSEIPPEDQNTMGLSPGLVRVSMGYTNTINQQVEALEKALKLAQLV